MILFRNLPLAALLALVIVGGGLAYLLYRTERRRLSAPGGRCLATLRILLILLLLVALAEPVLRTERLHPVEPALLVVMDGSRSFFLTDPHRSDAEVREEARAFGESRDPPTLDALRSASRVERAAWALASGSSKLDRYRVERFAVASELFRLADDATRTPQAYTGGTDLGDPLVQTVLARTGENLSAVLLLSDGNHHGASDPRRAAAFLGRLGVPIVAVGVGASEPPRDLAVVAVDATGHVFPGDEVRAQVTVRTSGFEALDVPLEVLEGDAVIARTPLSIAGGSRTQVVEVRFTADSTGSREYQVRLPAQAGEVSVENNAQTLHLDVLEGRARVLLLDRMPRWEWRYLRDGWTREEHVTVDAFVVDARRPGALPEGFPVTRDELLAYDLVVWGDVPPARLPSEWVAALREFVVARGGTLVALAGEAATPARWTGTPLEDLLPVALLEPAPDARLGREIARGGLRLSLTALGETSELTRLVAGRERNARLWELLPRPEWLAPVAKVRPGVRVLVSIAESEVARLPGFRQRGPGARPTETAEHREQFARERGPVFVTRAVGAGQVLYAGIDATWRWRYRFGNELHDRFWGQVVRWAMSEGFRASDAHVRLGTDGRLYRAPATVQVAAWIRDASGDPFDGDQVTAVVEAVGASDASESRRIPLRAIVSSSGRFEGELRLDPHATAAARTLHYRLRLEIPGLSGYRDLPDPAVVSFGVEPRADPELLDWQCDQELLGAMARLSGGVYFPLSGWQEALASLPRREGEQVRLVECSLWDYPLSLAAVLFGLLLTEWILRKRYHLI